MPDCSHDHHFFECTSGILVVVLNSATTMLYYLLFNGEIIRVNGLLGAEIFGQSV